MLHEVLKKEACAACRFCCAFRRKSLWEVPRLPVEFAEKYPVDRNGKAISYRRIEDETGIYVITDLSGAYLTEDAEEEAPCPFLDTERGCVLPENDKPFDCKIWPLRYMRMPSGSMKVCLTPTCPEINQIPAERMKQLVDHGLGDLIAGYAEKHPYMIKEYKDGFLVL